MVVISFDELTVVEDSGGENRIFIWLINSNATGQRLREIANEVGV